MGHSIAARYAARPAARFIRPSSRARERRLGLGALSGFSATSHRQTELRATDISPLAAIRSRRGLTLTGTVARSGRVRPTVTMLWTGSGATGPGRRTRAATAPWRA
ncbi:MAG: hypothetical protein ACLGIJ_13010 [Candidatus Limnocylindria bacterium]